jgi:DNA-binding transcriptional MerR regulator
VEKKEKVYTVKRWLRIGEVARELKCSVEWLRDAEKLGKMPPAKQDIEGWQFYDEEDIEELKRRLFSSQAEG